MRKKAQTNHIEERGLNVVGNIKKNMALFSSPAAYAEVERNNATRWYSFLVNLLIKALLLVEIFCHFLAGNFCFVMDHRDQVTLFI
jgi:hypothetical protein